MAIKCEFYNIIIPKSVIEGNYPGGLERYKENCPNKSFIEDGYLTRVGFMNGKDSQDFIEDLEQGGLVHCVDGKSKDFAVLQSVALFKPCEWIKTGLVDNKICCWLKGTEPGEVKMMTGVTYPDINCSSPDLF